MLPISVCIIAKNEEPYIEECLRRLSHFDWEIVVVDTGSTDRTIEIARAYTPNVYHFDWINDFSAARNYSVRKASNNYILVVDCDEYLQADSVAEDLIAHLTEQITPSQAGLFHRISPSASLSSLEHTESDNNIYGESVSVSHEQIARFFHRQYTHYEGTIHEQLVSRCGKPLEFISVPLTFYHVGYSTSDMKHKKASRNIAMLEASLEKQGADPYVLFQLGQSYFGLADYSLALPYFEQALSMDVNEKEEYVQTMVESYGYCLLNLQLSARALELEGIYHIFSKTADFVFLMGLIYMNNAMFHQAIHEFLKAVSITKYSVEGVNSYKAYYNIGVIYECMGDMGNAVKYYDKCGDYTPAIERKNAISPYS